MWVLMFTTPLLPAVLWAVYGWWLVDVQDVARAEM